MKLSTHPWLDDIDPESLPESKIHQLVSYAGRMRGLWADRAAGLIYLADRHGVPQKKGFRDIHHYGAVVGRGFTRDQINEFLRIGRAVASTVKLKELFLKGTVGWSKFVPVLKLISPESDADLAEMLRTMSKRELERYVRDRARQSNEAPDTGGSMNPEGSLSGGGPEKEERPESATGSRKDALSEGVPAGPGSGRREPGQGGDPAGDSSRTGGDETITGAETSPPCPGAEQGVPDVCGSLSGDPEGQDRVRLDVQVDSLTFHRLRMIQAELSALQGPVMSLGAVVDWMVEKHGVEGGKRLEYVEVVVRDPARNVAFVRTGTGPRFVADAELALRKRKGQVLDLEEEYRALTREIETPVTPAESAELPCIPDSIPVDPPGPVCQGDRSGIPETSQRSAQDDFPGRPPPHIEALPAPDERHSRHIPARIQRFIRARDGGLCVFPGCSKPEWALHHIDRFIRTGQHEVDRIVSVCRDHHWILHHRLVANEDAPASEWRLMDPSERVQSGARATIDQRVVEHRLRALSSSEGPSS